MISPDCTFQSPLRCELKRHLSNHGLVTCKNCGKLLGESFSSLHNRICCRNDEEVGNLELKKDEDSCGSRSNIEPMPRQRVDGLQAKYIDEHKHYKRKSTGDFSPASHIAENNGSEFLRNKNANKMNALTFEKETKRSVIRFIKFQCCFCRVSQTIFDCYGSMWRHMESVHCVEENEKEHSLQCLYCDEKKTFQKGTRRRLLIARMMSHMMRKHDSGIPDYIDPFFCHHPGCNYMCILKKDLEAHMFHHRNSEHSPCELCGKVLRPHYLKLHKAVCSGNKQAKEVFKKFKCDICDGWFRLNSQLRKHVKFIHDKVRDFLCIRSVLEVFRTWEHSNVTRSAFTTST